MKDQHEASSREGFVLALILLVIVLLVACAGTTNSDDNSVPATRATNRVPTEDEVANDSSEEEAGDPENPAEEDALASWLQQIQTGEIADVRMDADLEWARGFFLYYSSLDSIRALAIDQIIYHALEARRRLDTGEFAEETVTRNARNLLTIAEGIQYDSSAIICKIFDHSFFSQKKRISTSFER